MKLLGRWSLASFLKHGVDVYYYFLITVIPVILVIAVLLAVVAHRHESWPVQLPVRLEFNSGSQSRVTSPTNGIQSASVIRAHGTLQVVIPKLNTLMAWAGWGEVIIWVAITLIVLNRLRAIFGTLRDKDPFVAVNASRIRTIALVLIFGELIGTVAGGLAGYRVTGDISMAGLKVYPDYSFNSAVIFAGLILLMVAEVFRLGADMKGDIETARKIQLDLVPGEVFRESNVAVHARMRPARIVGGDYYDVLKLDNGRLALFVGDVSGKGMPAAMLMATVLGSTRALSSAGLRGCALIAALNRHVCASTSSGRFVTLFYAEIDTATGATTYVNAGHNSPLVLRGDGGIERLESTAMVLGVNPDTEIEARQVEINPGDRLLLFTDGFSEAFNKADEEYGEARLRESFVRARSRRRLLWSDYSRMSRSSAAPSSRTTT
jgi:hypothetical protein